MTTYLGTTVRRAGAAVLTTVCLGTTLLSAPRPLQAQAAQAQTPAPMVAADQGPSGSGGFFTVRRTFGVVFLAGSAVLVKQGFNLKDEADRFYDAYKAATDEAEISKFYQRTTNRDVRSQVSWALAAAFGITGLRLIFTGGDDGASVSGPAYGAATPAAASPAVTLAPAVTPRAVGLSLQRHFF